MAPVIDLGTRGIAVTGKTDVPVIQISNSYAFQSYFDSTLLEKAILFQPQGQQIVPSTEKVVSVAGYAVGLHPSSQSPVAVRFVKGAQSGDSGVIILKPGQIVRPNGEQGDRDGRFSGFTYGLPFGWLGGGNVSLVVFRTPDAKVDWIDRSELIFHRQRVQILAPAALVSRVNWPIAFPWANALQGANSLPQGGTPNISVTPTRIAMALLLGTLGAAATMRMSFVNSEFETTDVAYDVVWGTWASFGGTQYQLQFLPVEAFRLGGSACAMTAIDATGTLSGGAEPVYVDIVRYGVL